MPTTPIQLSDADLDSSAPQESQSEPIELSADDLEQPAAPVNPYAHEAPSMWSRLKGDFAEGVDTIRGVVDPAMQTTPYSSDKGVLGNARAAAANLGAGATRLFAGPLVHPIQTIKGLSPQLPVPGGGTESLSGYTPPPEKLPTRGEGWAEVTAALPGMALMAAGARGGAVPEAAAEEGAAEVGGARPAAPPEPPAGPASGGGGGGPQAPTLPSSGGGGGVATATRTQVKAPTLSPADQALADKLSQAQRSPAGAPSPQLVELQARAARAKAAADDLNFKVSQELQLRAAQEARGETPSPWNSQLFKSAQDAAAHAKALRAMADELQATAKAADAHFKGLVQGQEPPPGAVAPRIPSPAEVAADYVGKVKSGVPPAIAAAGLGMTPQDQEHAHVAAFFAPHTIAAVALPKPAAPAPQEQGAPPTGAVGQQQQSQQDTIDETAARAAQIQQQASDIANGIPPPKPPTVPLPKGMDSGSLNQDTLDSAGSILMALPATERPKAILEATGNIAQWLFDTKTAIAPDGKVVNVDSQKSAQSEAVNIINAEIDRQNEMIKERAKQQQDAQNEAQKQVEATQKESEKNADTAQEEKEAALNPETPKEGESAEPETEIPDSAPVRMAQKLLESLSGDPTSEQMEKAIRTRGILLTDKVRKAMVAREVKRRAHRKEDQAQTSMTGEPIAEGQSREQLEAWFNHLKAGEEPYAHVPAKHEYKPSLDTGKQSAFTKTTVRNSPVAGFNGDYYHAKDIKSQEIRDAAQSPNPQDALDALKAKWKGGAGPVEVKEEDLEPEEKPVEASKPVEKEETEPETKPAEPETKKPEAETKPELKVGQKIRFTAFSGEEMDGIIKAFKPNGQPVVLTAGGHRTPVPLDKIIHEGPAEPKPKEDEKPAASEPEPAPEQEEQTETITEAKSLQQYLYEQIEKDGMPKDNPALRKIVEQFDGKAPDQARMKEAQEALEAAIARWAHDIVTTMSGGDEAIFNALLKLYAAQPNLNIRSSTSVENQAYSTPAPLAFLAGRLAGITEDTTVYEPTAGNGMLLITATPELVHANELNDLRAKNLAAQGFQVTQKNAATFVPSSESDSVIANPPFGPLKGGDGKNIKQEIDGYRIGQLDHLIAVKSLEAMKADGKATLILGAGKMAGEISDDTRVFLNWLYGHYNVTSHFEMNGDLYSRQGAGWPVRIITIHGREKSDKVGPAPGVIKRAETWKEVYEQFSESLAAQSQPRGSGPGDEAGGSAPIRQDDQKPVRAASGGQAAGGNRPRPAASAAGPRDEPEPAPEHAGDSDHVPAPGVGSADSDERPDADAAEPGELEETGEPEAGKPEATVKPPRTARVNTLAAEDNQLQVKYTPYSAQKDEGVLIPTNMRDALDKAMARLEDAVGDLDDYVQKELQYKTRKEMHDALMGLQVDAIAAAIYQMRLGKATIIADQTGIGKGRQAAAIIRWAIINKKIPVFMTAQDSLFSDIYGDLVDIGSPHVKPYILNADVPITTADGKKLFKSRSGTRSKDLASIRDTGALPGESNAIFSTYSQINTANVQRDLLKKVAPDAVLILDESHRAAGESNTGEFMLDLVSKASSTTYLSATYAKRPDNMPLYHKTDIGIAVKDQAKMFDVMLKGGLPLQTVVSNNLVTAGQMFRRERSYDGIELREVTDTARSAEHREMADEATKALRMIVDADRAFGAEDPKVFTPFIPQGGGSTSQAGNKASTTINHTEFTAIVHNFVRQMLLGMKADSAADAAIDALKRGEKPIIALDNTMGSFLSAYAEDHGLSAGQELKDFDYRTVLSRALARTRRLLVKLPGGQRLVIDIPLDALSPEAQYVYKNAQKLIDGLDLKLPVSPIDHIRQRIKDAGYTVAEITGRSDAVDYSGKVPKLTAVPAAERDDRVATTRRFNGGTLDVLIMNVAGSTGISLHASVKFKDKRQRFMIVAQPAQDINVFMQMLGRIHRTGQVVLPKYWILSVDLPAEKRPTALLSKKMKSLNANTSSNTESATSVKSVDMLNKYGDEVVANYLLNDDRVLARILGLTPDTDKDGNATGEANPDLARKATGRLALMPVEVQEQFYKNVEHNYSDLIDYLNATNQNDLEPKTLDYAAKLNKEQVIHEGQDPSTPFGEDAIYGEYTIKSQGKPMMPEEVKAKIEESLKGFDGHNVYTRASKQAQSFIDGADKGYKSYVESLNPEGDGRTKASSTRGIATSAMQEYKVGTALSLTINDEQVYGVVTSVGLMDTGSGNPFSLSKIRVELAVASPIRHLKLSFSQMLRAAGKRTYRTVDDLFDPSHQANTQEAKIVTGNLLGAYGAMHAARGRIIHFTKEDGTTDLGILLPNNFDVAQDVDRSYSFRTPQQVVEFLEKTNREFSRTIGVSAPNGNVRITYRDGETVITTPTSKKHGSRYFLDKDLIRITGDFLSTGGEMRVTVPNSKRIAAIRRIMDLTTLEVPASKADEARALVEKPKDDPGATFSAFGVGALDPLARKLLQPAVDYTKKAFAATWNEALTAAGKTGKGARNIGRELVAVLYPAALAETRSLNIMGSALGEPQLRLYEAGQFLYAVDRMFDQMSPDGWTSFVDAIERGDKQPTPELDQAAEMLKAVLEAQREREQAAINLDRKGREIELSDKANYFPHRYRKAPGRGELPSENDYIQSIVSNLRRPFEGSKSFMKIQRYTYKQAVEEGAEPIGNPVQMVLKRLQEGAKFVGARYAIHNFKDQGIMLFRKRGKPMPAGFALIKDKFAQVWRVIESTEENLNGENRTFPVQTGDWVMQENAARLLNNYLSVDHIRGSEVGNAFIKLKNLTTEIRLAISAFHWLYITTENVASGLQQGLDKFYNMGVRRLDPAAMADGAAEIGRGIVAPYTAIKVGGQMIQYARNPEEFLQSKEGKEFVERYPDYAHLMELLFRGGLRWQLADTFQQSFGAHCVEAWKAGEMGKGLGKLLPWLAHGIAKPLFEHYIPRSKWAFAVELLSKKLAQYSYAIEQGTKTEEEIAREVAATTDNRFGELNWDSLYLNNNMRTAMQFFWRSATWKLGSWRGAVKAGKETFTSEAFDDRIFELMDAEAKKNPGVVAELRRGTSRLPQMGVNAGWVVSMMLTVAMVGAPFEYMATGKFPWQWAKNAHNSYGYMGNTALESMHPRTGEVDAHGEPIRLSFPTGLKDYEHGFENPTNYLKGSESDVVSNALDTLTNEDAFGNYVFNPQDPTLVKFWQGLKYNAAGDFEPMSVSNFTRSYGPQDVKSKLLRSTGVVGGAPKGLDRSHALSQAIDMRRPRAPMTPEMEESYKERQFLKATEPTARQVRQAAREKNMDYLERIVLHEMSYENAMKIYNDPKTTDEERKGLKPIVDRKRILAVRAAHRK